MRPRLFPAVLLCGVLAHPVAAQDATEAPAPLTYVCERGVEIPVITLPGDPGLVVLWVEGQLVALPRTPSASGTRYEAADGRSGYVWWSRGDSASLAWYDSDVTEQVTLFRDCRASE